MKVAFKNKWVILISVIILVVVGFVIYKTQFTNPVGVDNEFYKDRLFVYETIMEAFEEERELTIKEKIKIEEIIEGYQPENSTEGKINIFVSSMYYHYDSLTNDKLEDYEKEKYIDNFTNHKKHAENILKIK